MFLTKGIRCGNASTEYGICFHILFNSDEGEKMIWEKLRFKVLDFFGRRAER